MDDLKAILDAAAKEVTVDCWADIQTPREAFCRTSLSSGPSTHRLERMAPDLAADNIRLERENERLRKALEKIRDRSDQMVWGEDHEIAAAMRDMEEIARAALEGRE